MKSSDKFMSAFSSNRSWLKNSMIAAAILTVGSAGILSAASVRAADSSLDSADKSFLTKATQAGDVEVQASKLALEKSSNPAVKDFASKMIEDHAKLNIQVKTLADSKGVKVPAEPSLMQRGKLAALGKMNGATFDKEYASMIGVSAHEDAVKLFSKTSETSKDTDIKTLASTTLPSLQSHLHMGETLKTETGK